MTEPNVQTVLIVDESTKDRSQFKGLLTNRAGQSYQILEAETASAGMKICRRRKPDCVLMSSRLADGQNLSFLHALKADPALRELPVVVMVASDASQETSQKAFSGGALECLRRDSLSQDTLVRATHNAMQMTALNRCVTQEKALRASAEATLHRHGFARPYLHLYRAQRRATLLLGPSGNLVSQSRASKRWMQAPDSRIVAGALPFFLEAPAQLQEQLDACLARGTARAVGHVYGPEGGLIAVSVNLESLDSAGREGACFAVTLTERPREREAAAPDPRGQTADLQSVLSLTKSLTQALTVLKEAVGGPHDDGRRIRAAAKTLRKQAQKLEGFNVT